MVKKISTKKRKILGSTMSFIPRRIIEPRVKNKKVKPYEFIDCAILCADISGFTSMGEKLAAMGKEGAEELTSIINSFFEPLIQIIVERGGDIYRFGGDAILAIFQASDEVLAGERALVAAQQAVKLVNRFARVKTSEGTFKIKIHIALAGGEIYFKDLKKDFFIGGKLGNDVMKILDLAKPGEIIVNTAVKNQTEGVEFRKVKTGIWKFVKVRRHKKVAKEKVVKKVRIPSKNMDANTRKLRAYLPDWLNKRIEIKQEFGHKDGEHRKISSTFVHFSGIPFNKNPKKASKMMTYLYISIIENLGKYDGWLSKLDIYSDSIRALVIFGFPRAYENDEQRIMLFVHDLLNSPKLKNIKMRAGINSGFAFATPIGSDARREYTVMGDAINLSARMGSFASSGSVLVSEAVYKKNINLFNFQKLRKKQVKGKRQKLQFYRVESKKEYSIASISKWLSESEKIVGRKKEIDKFIKLKNFVRSGKGQIIGLEGEAGVGKSRLTREFLKELQSSRFSIFEGDCLSYGKSLSYHPWIEILMEFFEILPTDPVDVRKKKIKKRIRQVNPKFIAWLPVIGEVIGISFPETSLTKFLDAKIRKQRFFDIVFDFLKYSSKKKPVCVVIEDLHWIDSVSLELVNYIGRNIYDKKMIFLLVFRPISEKIEFMEKEFYSYLRIKELSQDDTVVLVKNLLNVKAMPEEFKRLVLNRSQGNPFYVEEIVKSLIEQRFIVEEKKKGWKFAGDMKRLSLPGTVEGVILSRIDRLDITDRNVLQTAAVIGREFDQYIITGIYPDRKELDRALNNLKKLDLIKLEKGKKDVKYFFKHILTREVAYDTISFAKKRETHLNTASFIEKKLKARKEEFLGLLSYHFYQAREYDKSLLYSVEAGEKAKKVYANEEAIEFFTRAIDSYHNLEKVEKARK